jgi:hypothetical protein
MQVLSVRAHRIIDFYAVVCEGDCVQIVFEYEESFRLNDWIVMLSRSSTASKSERKEQTQNVENVVAAARAAALMDEEAVQAGAPAAGGFQS